MEQQRLTELTNITKHSVQTHKFVLGIAIFAILVPVFMKFAKMSIDTIRTGNPKSWVIASDGLGYYATLRSFMIDHDLNFANEFRDYNLFHNCVQDYTRTTRTGHVPQKYPIGMALVWAPFFLVAHSMIFLLAAFGVRIIADGYSLPYQLLIGIGSIFYGIFGLFFLYRTIVLYFNKLIASFSILSILLGTNMLYYFVNEPTMSHITGMGFVTCFLYYVLSAKGIYSQRRLLLLGFLMGLMTVIRYQNALFGIVWVFEYLRNSETRTFKAVARALLFGAIGCIPFVVMQMIFWKIIFGNWVVYSYENEGFHFLHPHFLKILFSSYHGLISWTPMVGLCCLGLILFIVKTPVTGIGVLIIFLAQLYINASWSTWWFGDSYGSRAFVECSGIFCLGMAALMEKTLKRAALRNSMALILLVLIAWNTLFSAMYMENFVPNGYFNWIDLLKSLGPSLSKIASKPLRLILII
jgi:hypothetical protein